MHALTSGVIAGAGLYLLVLGVAALLMPSRVESFLGKFASSAFSHYLEVSIRLIVGAALVHKGATLSIGVIFEVFGWVLLATSLVLLCIPWQWHRKFARFAVPLATRMLPAVGVAAIVLGLALLSVLFEFPRV